MIKTAQMEQYPQIDILMATYNGERFIDEQVRSLLEQSYVHWRLIIRDDGSTDNTREFISRFKEQYPAKIIVIGDDLGNLGVCRNFGRLLEHSSADYVMFCDQDDVWLPRKIEMTLGKMRALEARHDSDRPLLVYTDMYVVDDTLSVISDSFWRHKAVTPRIGKSLNRCLVGNVVTGCTMMINKKLREMSVPFLNDIFVHDWWLALVSVALGGSDYLDQPTVFYRQHEMNAIGATWDMGIRGIGRRLHDFPGLRRKYGQYMIKTQKQAAAFASRYKKILSADDYRTITTFANLGSQNYIQKRLTIIRHGFWWAGFVRSMVMLIII